MNSLNKRIKEIQKHFSNNDKDYEINVKVEGGADWFEIDRKTGERKQISAPVLKRSKNLEINVNVV